jgi:hypothetical protein
MKLRDVEIIGFQMSQTLFNRFQNPFFDQSKRVKLSTRRILVSNKIFARSDTAQPIIFRSIISSAVSMTFKRRPSRV